MVASSSSANPSGDVQFAGVNVMQYFKEARNRIPAPRTDAVNDFIDSESGRALFEAVPSPYATLETLETDPRLATLQAPFGVLVTMLQITTTKYGGFSQADAVLGHAHANALRGDRHESACAFSGKRFIVHRGGLFDAVSKSRSLETKKSSLQCTGPDASSGPSSGIRRILKNGNGICDDPGECFGRCGEGC
jgi:hypothetical protein